MGVPAYLVASSVIAVQAQRLVRRYCACRGAVSGSARGTIGCEGCRSTGLRGRIGIFELLRVTPKVRAVLLSGGSDDDIRAAAVASGMRTMFEDGKLKVEQGLTDMAEVLRVVLPPEEQAEAAFQNAPLPAAQAQGEAA
jgi:general secretion pathway protein E